MIQIKKLTELAGHNGAIYSLEQTERENCFYSGSGDKVVAKWNLDTLNVEKFRAQVPAIVYSLCHIAKKNVLLAGTSEGKIHVLDAVNKKEIKILDNHTHPVFDIQSSLDGIILSADGDGVLSILSEKDFSTIKIIKMCNEKLRSIDIHGNKAAIACGDGMIRIVDLTSLKINHEFYAHKNSVYTVKFLPDGKGLLSGGKDAHLNVWRFQPETYNLKLEITIPAHNYAIYSIVFSPDGKLTATASRDKTIKIWDATTFEMLVRINKENFEGHINSVNKLLWSTYNNYLISAGDDRKIMVWKIR